MIMGEGAALTRPLVSCVKGDSSSYFISPLANRHLAIGGALLVMISARGTSFISSGGMCRGTRGMVIVSRREGAISCVGGTIVFCRRPRTSSAYRVMARLLRCVDGRPITSSIYTATLVSNVVLSAGRFILETKMHAFRTTTCLHSHKTSAMAMGSFFTGSVRSEGLHNVIIVGTRVCHTYTVSIASVRSSSVHIIYTRTTSRLLSMDNISTSFIVFGASSVVGVSTHSVNGMGIRLVVRTLNNKKRRAVTTIRLGSVARDRVGSVLGATVSGCCDGL